ncbi:hypothetical protein GCM10010466_55950 [Planomonospora alba]|uniref:Uncharacterized protein n=1 Tax=Planomonospora alba TaxID=161354 RepID=A0ABP6NTW1_9ACTN
MTEAYVMETTESERRKAERERQRVERERRRMEEAERWYRSSRFRHRRARRALVGVGAAAMSLFWIAAVVCWLLAPSDLAMWTTFALAGVGVAVYAPVMFVLSAATQGMINLGGALLDERQRAERDKVYALAHRGTMWVIIATGIMLGIPTRSAQVVAAPAAALILLAVALLLTHLALPHLIAGWRVPDPLPDDED